MTAAIDKTVEGMRKLFEANNEVRAKLLVLSSGLVDDPVHLQNARSKAVDAKTALELAEAVTASREAEIRWEVLAAEKEPGKPLYTNDGARNAEVKRRLAADGVYKHLAAEQAACDRASKNAVLEISRLEDERRRVEKQIEAISKSADLIISASTLLGHVLLYQKETLNA